MAMMDGSSLLCVLGAGMRLVVDNELNFESQQGNCIPYLIIIIVSNMTRI